MSCKFCGWYEIEEVEEANDNICTKCFRWQSEEDEIEVSNKTAWSIVENGLPRGLFYTKSGDVFVGIDNSTGETWVEDFKTIEECKKWLNGEVEK